MSDTVHDRGDQLNGTPAATSPTTEPVGNNGPRAAPASAAADPNQKAPTPPLASDAKGGRDREVSVSEVAVVAVNQQPAYEMHLFFPDDQARAPPPAPAPAPGAPGAQQPAHVAAARCPVLPWRAVAYVVFVVLVWIADGAVTALLIENTAGITNAQCAVLWVSFVIGVLCSAWTIPVRMPWCGLFDSYPMREHRAVPMCTLSVLVFTVVTFDALLIGLYVDPALEWFISAIAIDGVVWAMIFMFHCIPFWEDRTNRNLADAAGVELERKSVAYYLFFSDKCCCAALNLKHWAWPVAFVFFTFVSLAWDLCATAFMSDDLSERSGQNAVVGRIVMIWLLYVAGVFFVFWSWIILAPAFRYSSYYNSNEHRSMALCVLWAAVIFVFVLDMLCILMYVQPVLLEEDGGVTADALQILFHSILPFLRAVGVRQPAATESGVKAWKFCLAGVAGCVGGVLGAVVSHYYS